jgi:hypothetical protein
MELYAHRSKAFLILLIALVFFGWREVMAIEQASYRVLEADREFELRQYAPQIVAETFVEGKFSEVGNEGFRRLFDYISGKNRSNRSIPMTAPVSQEAAPEKIAMTAPVTQERMGDRWRIAFLMPSTYTLENLPQPLDARVQLGEVPGALVAALRYSGTWSKERYEEKKSRLEALILTRGLKAIGEPVWARYNPPFTPWFLRRNEVLIAVEQAGQ